MLMPPGTCICRLVPGGGDSGGAVAVHGQPVLHTTKDSANCCCEGCRTSKEDAYARHHDEQPTKPIDGPTQPAPEKHWPGCPAASDAIPLSVVVQPSTVPVDYVVEACYFTHSETVATLVRSIRVPTPVVSPPLFISHCALLI
jgi:hypothetical protein